MTVQGTRLLVEQGPGEAIAFGPLIGPDEAACIACFKARRRAASGTAFGVLRAIPANAASLPAAASLLAEHQLCVGPAGPVRGRFVPLPSCRCARSRAMGGDIEDLVGGRLGLIRQVWSFESMPGLITAVAEGAATLGSAGGLLPVRGSATDADPCRSRRHAIAEALERYAAGFWAEDTLIGPAEAPLVSAVLAIGGDVVRVPAGTVFQPFRDAAAPFDASGLAAGHTAGDATARAVAERVERNIIAELLAGGGAARRLPGPPGQADLVLARSQGHYVCASLSTGSVAPPHATIGFGAARGLEAARAKAQTERCHVEAHMRRLTRQPAVSLAGCSAIDRLVHELAFGSAPSKALLARLLAAPTLRGAMPATGGGGDIAVVDVTTPDLRRFGLFVIRAVNMGPDLNLLVPVPTQVPRQPRQHAR